MMEFTEIRKLFHIHDNIGYPEEAVSAAVRKFGRLPGVLMEYYIQLGQCQKLNHAYYHFCAPAQLKLLEHGNRLCFCNSDSESLYWYLDTAQLDSDNPPVYYCYADEMNEGDGVESDTLEVFLNGFACFQALFSLPYNSGSNFLCTFQQAERIRNNYLLKPYTIEGLSFYGNSSDEVINMQTERSGAMVMYACTSEEQLRKIEMVLRGQDI